jgi:hypothetical protein
LEAQIVEVAAVEAGEHRDGEDLQVALRRRRGLHDSLVAMDGGEGHPALRQERDGAADRRRNVEQLEVREDTLVLPEQPVHQLEVATGGHQLEAHLVEGDGVAQLLDDAPRVGGVGHVEGEDQAVTGLGGIAGDCHGDSLSSDQAGLISSTVGK